MLLTAYIVSIHLHEMPNWYLRICKALNNSYACAMACLPVRGDNPRALLDYLTHRWTIMV